MIGTHARRYATAESRWVGVGPYYAMFPARFADRVIEKYTQRGDTVIDPFAGRGTALFSAAVKGRHGLGVEINPVGWVYAAAKLRPAPRGRVERRLEEIGTLARFQKAAETLPEFFHHCFAPNVLDFLLAARRHLDWRRSAVDRTLMAILLVDLHGKRTLALSNQMRQTKSMSPEYAVRWWKERSLSPPERDPVAFVLKKLRWRYANGIPVTTGSHVYLGDSTHDLWAMRMRTSQYAPCGAKLLLTSPPYFGVTNYHYDQWLRLWLLGGRDYPCSYGEKHRGKFTNPAEYESLLYTAFAYAADLLAEDATIYVRTDRRPVTARITRQVLKEVFPEHSIVRRVRPVNGISQTRLFTNGSLKSDEIDLILTPGR